MRLEGKDGQNTLQYLFRGLGIEAAEEYLKQKKRVHLYKIITEDSMFNNEKHYILYKIHHMIQDTGPRMTYKGGS